MTRRLTSIAMLALSLLALPAEAEPECRITTYVWELQLEQIGAEEGTPDLQAAAMALGTKATLRGGYRDPARERDPVRAELVGSTDGAGLSVTLERKE
jgi:hypothetical protein